VTSTYPLPEGWSEPERFEDEIDADGLRLHRVGLSCRLDRAEAIGSAADWRTSPAARAQFELLERVVVLEAMGRRGATFPVRSAAGHALGQLPADQVFPLSPDPDVWAYARSNGVALHLDWTRACERAGFELVERDRVLRSWLGQITPVRVPVAGRDSPLSRTRSYEWSAFAFPARAGDLAPDVHVVGVFGFPCKPSTPLVFGYGARDSQRSAQEAAEREATQLLSFLWGEPVSERAPTPAPTPMCHLETYQCAQHHALLRSWLGGSHRPYATSAAEVRTAPADVSFVDLTPEWLAGKLCVARAVSEAALPLAFGLSPVTAHLPQELRIHPIP
jgi:hypothetical protein